jgi:hypothetical protein
MPTEWPDFSSIETEELAKIELEICQELASRKNSSREMALEAAKRIWPDLRKALIASGKEIGLNGGAEPILPDWAKEPVVALSGVYKRDAKSKKEALEIAQKKGDHWATIGELWLWVGGGGPIVERTLKQLGYGPKS